MPSRLTVPVDSVSAGPAPLLTDITMPSVMPPTFSAVPPSTNQQDHHHHHHHHHHHQQQQGQRQRQEHQRRRRGSATTTGTAKAAPASIIRKKSKDRDSSASRGGRVTFAGEADNNRRNNSGGAADNNKTYKSDGYRSSSTIGSDQRQHQHQQRRNSINAKKTPGSSRSIRSRTTTSSSSSTMTASSSTKKNESVARNRLELALRDQFDSSFTGSQGLSTLIGRRDAASIGAGGDSFDRNTKSSRGNYNEHDNDKADTNNNIRERENMASNTLAGSRSRVPGPNERLYKDRYGESIDDAIAKHRRDQPAKPLRDYNSMSENEKIQELEKVGSLLARLGICDNFSASQVSSSDQQSNTGSRQQQQDGRGQGCNTTRCSGEVDESGTALGSSSNSGRAHINAVDESRTTMGGSSHRSTRSRASGRDDVDESRTTVGTACRNDSSRSRVSSMHIDESRTTLGSDGNGSSTAKPSSQRHPFNTGIDESRTTIGSEEQREMEIESRPAATGTLRGQNSETIDDSRTTMDLGGANDTTACSSTRLDQSSVVFDFGGGSGGGISSGGCGNTSAVRTPKQDTSIRRRALNDDEDTNVSDMIDSPQEEESVHQQGITRLEESHFTCNADAGTVAETQGAISAAQPKFLFQTQTPQFDRNGVKNFDYDADSSQRSRRADDNNGYASRDRGDAGQSNDTTAQSELPLSTAQRETSSPHAIRRSSNNDASCSSVEMPRSAVRDVYQNDRNGDDMSHRNTRSQSSSFQSPVSGFASNRKRLATTSGKRGADMQRSRLVKENERYDDVGMMDHIDDDSFERDCPSEQIESPSQLLCSSLKSPPSDFGAATPSFLAAASQSPILQCDDSMMDEECSMEFRRKESPSFSQSPAFSQRRDTTSASSHQQKQQSSQYSKRLEQSPAFSQESPAFSHQLEECSIESKGQSPMSQRESQSPGFSPNRDVRSMSLVDEDSVGDESVAGGGGGVTRQVRIRGARRSVMNDTVESANCTVLPRRDRTRKDRGREYSRDVAPADIHMKDGEAYRLDPLRVRRPIGQINRSKRRASSVDTAMRDKRSGRAVSRSHRGISRSPPTISFPDPLSSFDRRTAERLEVISDWVMDEDCSGDRKGGRGSDESEDWFTDDESNGENDTTGKGIVISMNMQQIVGVTLKLIITNGAKPKSHKRSASPFGSQSQVSTTALNGGTLIVLRSKEDLEGWEGALRERTRYSVLNHAAMSSSERKRSKTAGKCAGFHIVITTYDALKSKESSFALDELGRVVHEKGSQGGWMASRSQSLPRSCEHLSVLHHLSWHRVVFVDVLGRQSYTSKPTTGRHKAARALNSKSRFIFFEKEKGGTNHLEDSFKENRKQLCAVAATLHIPENDAEDVIAGHSLVDFRDVRENEGQLDADESRYEEDESRYQDGQGYDHCDDEDSYSRCHSDSEIMMSPVRRR